METTESENRINESTPDSVRKRIRGLISWLIDWFKLTPRQIPPQAGKGKSGEKPIVKKYLSNDIYEFNHSNRRVAILIINSLFTHGGKERPFAGHDYTNMKSMFELMDFDVIVLENRTNNELDTELQEIRKSRQIQINCDCLACVISSHGTEVPIASSGDTSPRQIHHEFSTADNQLIPTDKILQEFNDDHCPNLKGKPRMFFIQACRNPFNSDNDPESRIDKGFTVNLVQEQVDNDNDVVPDNLKENVIDAHDVEFFKIPCHEDYLVMFTSSSGKYGWSQENKGGWLMYCLHTVFDELLDTNYGDFLQILTRVSWKMARDLEAQDWYNRPKSAAVIYHMLTKEIHLRPKFPKKTQLLMLKHFLCWIGLHWFSIHIS